jgi:hypothetical protein
VGITLTPEDFVAALNAAEESRRCTAT